ncbi:MAG: DNA mismatch repair endonuclease MutL [Lachnospiraceae bacterium]|nr:DNA mismatch repair endonuclease MutL [Lachnospiraceae bacterium]
MAGTINILDDKTIDRIAAGEVVEGPKSVIKELVENAIDAKATAISVEIKDGGISYIRVTDNGEGIEKSQIKRAFLRHTTSKIEKAEDLLSIKSLGFRGEALSSIAAVSQVELLTKTKDQLIGTRYCIEGSRETAFDEAGVPEGTTFIVRNLFYNTPARKKFLKSPQTEGGYVSDYMEKAMLANTDISFKYTVNGNVKLQSYGNSKALDVVYSIYGRDIMDNMLPISFSKGKVSIRGYVGKPVLCRSNHNLEIYYVNKRYIKSSLIKKALDEAYKPYLMLHKYPFVLLYFEIDPDMLDVNVHPAKMEVRFINSMELYDCIVTGIRDTLKKAEMIVDIKEEEKKPEISKPLPEPFERAARAKEFLETREEDFREKPAPRDFEAWPSEASHTILSEGKGDYISDNTEKNTVALDPVKEEFDRLSDIKQISILDDDRFLTADSKRKYKIIGQLFDTYWMIELFDELFIIDQHAAHEKIRYERLVKQLHENNICSQLINPPVIVTLSKAEENILENYYDHFLQCGFDIESFGGNEYSIRAVPTELWGLTAEEYFHDILDLLEKEHISTDVSDILHRIATISCKGAIKGNQRISQKEAEVLIDELMTLENPYHCPHGRPVIVKFRKNEIEKMFKRIV